MTEEEMGKTIIDFFKELSDNQQDLPPEFKHILDNNWWEMLQQETEDDD